MCARNEKTAVVGEDTDLLILLLHNVEMDSSDLYLAPEAKQTSKTTRLWNTKHVKATLDPAVSNNILFIHAILGCDTTSRLYGLGKALVVKKLKLNEEEIIMAGEKALVSLYGGSHGESIDDLRYRRFCENVSKTTEAVEPNSLPPTSAAANFHSLKFPQGLLSIKRMERNVW